MTSPGTNSARELAALLAGGVAAGASFWPTGAGWLFWFVFVPFFWVILKKDTAGAFLRGWFFGIAVWASGIYWLVAPLSAFLGIPYAAALAVFSGICAWHGLMFAILAAASNAGSRYLSLRLGWREGTALLWTAIPAMAAIESFFPMLFPVYFANTQFFHLPLVQISELTGPAGLVWLIMGFNIALYGMLKAWRDRMTVPGSGPGGLRSSAAVFCAACVLVLLNEGYGSVRMRQVDAMVKDRLSGGRSLNVSVIQGSVPVDAPPGEVNSAALELYRRLTNDAARASHPDLIIWPESVYGRTALYTETGARPARNAALTPDFKETLARDIPEELTLLIGSRAELSGRPHARFNAAYAIGPEKRLLGLTLKRRLFPFGEFMPLGKYLPVLYRLSPGTEKLSPGGETNIIEVKGAKLGALICYEDLDTGMAGLLARKGADILVNISNEIGFGSEVAPGQHLMLSALRAVETRRFFFRAANTGISAVIDPCGRLVASLAPGERSFVTERAALAGAPTFYSRYPYLFLSLGFLALVVLIFLIIITPGPPRPVSSGKREGSDG